MVSNEGTRTNTTNKGWDTSSSMASSATGHEVTQRAVSGKDSNDAFESATARVQLLDEQVTIIRQMIRDKECTSDVTRKRHQLLSTCQLLRTDLETLRQTSQRNPDAAKEAALRKLRRQFDGERKKIEKLNNQITLLERRELAILEKKSTALKPTSRNPFSTNAKSHSNSASVAEGSVSVFVRDEDPELAILRERQNDLARIERETLSLQTLVQDVSVLMEKQGDELASVEVTSSKTAAITEKGATDMLKAVDRRTKRWRRLFLFSCISFTVLAAIASTVLLILKYVYGHI